jgi:uncharacterized C2H2 Zn-finger protein
MSFHQHVVSAQDTGDLLCPKCNAKFSSRSNFTRHARRNNCDPNEKEKHQRAKRQARNSRYRAKLRARRGRDSSHFGSPVGRTGTLLDAELDSGEALTPHSTEVSSVRATLGVDISLAVETVTFNFDAVNEDETSALDSQEVEVANSFNRAYGSIELERTTGSSYSHTLTGPDVFGVVTQTLITDEEQALRLNASAESGWLFEHGFAGLSTHKWHELLTPFVHQMLAPSG